MKVWHDNSGRGDEASWFLKHIIVRDLQTREKFYFLCQDWLAVERGDGKIERELFVACEAQKTRIKYLMQKQFKYYVMDNHLWFSVFYKPVQSSFSRFDRVNCCFLFYYVSMFLNIMYFGIFNFSISNINGLKNDENFIGISFTFEQVFILCLIFLSFIKK